jgi:hypothetical protein
MSQFISRLRTVAIGRINRRMLWRVTSPLIFDDTPWTQLWTVPAGYITDYSSVPHRWCIWYWFSDHGHAASTLHDWLCQQPELPHVMIDEIFRRALHAEDISEMRASLMFQAVRWRHFLKNR